MPPEYVLDEQLKHNSTDLIRGIVQTYSATYYGHT